MMLKAKKIFEDIVNIVNGRDAQQSDNFDSRISGIHGRLDRAEKAGVHELETDAKKSPASPENISKQEAIKKENAALGKINAIEREVNALKTAKNYSNSSGKYDAIEFRINEISKKISDISREMDLDHAMYPKNIAGIQKELSDLKSVQKEIYGILEQIPRMDGKIIAFEKEMNLDRAIYPENIMKLETAANNLKNAHAKMDKRIKSLEQAVSEKIIPEDSEITRRIGQVKANCTKSTNELKESLGEIIKAIETQKSALESYKSRKDAQIEELLPEISAIKNETENMKQVNKQIIEMIEIDSRTLHDLKSIRDSDTNKNIVPKLEKEIAAIKSAHNNLDNSVKEIKEDVRGITGVIEEQKNAVESRKGKNSEDLEALSEITAIKKEIENLKQANEKIVEMIDIDSKAIRGLKSRSNDTDYKKIRPEMAELSKKISDIRREIDLDRAMYPKTIMNLENDVKNLKELQKGLADAVESIAKMKTTNLPAGNAKDIQILKNEINLIKEIQKTDSESHKNMVLQTEQKLQKKIDELNSAAQKNKTPEELHPCEPESIWKKEIADKKDNASLKTGAMPSNNFAPAKNQALSDKIEIKEIPESELVGKLEAMFAAKKPDPKSVEIDNIVNRLESVKKKIGTF